MESARVEKIAFVASVVAVLAALAAGRLPRWLRITLIVCLAVLACAAGLIGYRYATHPIKLTVATGSIDGEATSLMSAIETRMADTDAPVRLKVIDKGTALAAGNAFAAGETDLAIVRADIGDLSSARTVVVMTYAVALLAVPPGSPIESMDDLKGKTVGVIGLTVNQKLVAAIVKAYDLDRAKVVFKDTAPKDATQMLQSKQVQALLVVMPISEKYLGMLRDVFPRSAKLKPALIPLDLAGAVAASGRAYESYDLPKGTLRGSPPIPDDDLTTLRVPLYLVANKNLGGTVVAALAKAMMDVRRDLVGEYPLLAQIAPASADKDAYIPIHPGAAAYFDGEQQSFLDKYADKLFYLAMLLGFLASALAAAWKFMTKDAGVADERPLTRLSSLIDQIRAANSEVELTGAEREIDEIFRSQLVKYSGGEAETAECAAVGMAIQRLERLISERRARLRDRPTVAV